MFGIPLEEHLSALAAIAEENDPVSDIAFVIEYCVCFLLEKGFQEEGLFRVGHTAHKLSRLKSAIDAGIVNAKNLPDIHDPHVIAALLKNYLRSLPDPLLTYDLYREFISIASLQPEHGLKQEILRVLKKLPQANYDNLRYLMAFFSDLKDQISKTRMTTQNIAIVISPNLLWAENEKDQGYSEQVSSTAAVNTIVEQLVSDYAYFFGEPVIFYKTLKKPVCKATPRQMSSSTDHVDDNGGFVSDTNEPLTTAVMSQSMGPSITNSSKTHTPRSSDGTNQITLQSVTNIPRTGSNNSMSDSSSPPQRSPRPARRKHNKAPAPTPTHEKHEAETQTKTVFRTVSDAASPNSTAKSNIKRTTSNEDMRRNDESSVSNPTYGYHTISRSSVREKPSRPSPAPRNTMKFDDPSKIYANFDLPVTIREKPAIPERPANLPVRPNSINRSVADHFKSEQSPPADAKKTQDEYPTSHESTTTQLERIQSFSIDKQQVAIIDIGGSSNNGSEKRNSKRKSSRERSLDLTTHESQENTVATTTTTTTESNNNNNSSNNYEYSLQQVPRSPRENKNVKRPQVPAPPPPTLINPTSGDSPSSSSSFSFL